ncbi:MAG TPA: ArsA-related P-loop ATPase [Polyangia bacterium]|nr:ArsA-related P-loop ATPase [Polyangia bacterium]
MTSLLKRQLIVLSGKGGVGRTTVAAALARAAADAGKRVLIAQASAAERLGRIFGRFGPVGTDIVTLAPGIDAVNMTPQSALHEYGLMVLRSELVTRAVFENRAVRGFLGAIPGLDAYAMLGKAWWHTTEMSPSSGASAPRRRYDLVIFDGPASGHATLTLRIPGAILAAMPKGPLARDARAIRLLLSDPARAALVIVTLAEELPARETAELAAAARGPLQIPLGPVIVNAVPSDALSDPGSDAVLGPLAPSSDGDAALEATLRLARTLRSHRRIADEQLERLRLNPGGPLMLLPRLPTADIGPAELAVLAARIAAADAAPPDPAAGGHVVRQSAAQQA